MRDATGAPDDADDAARAAALDLFGDLARSDYDVLRCTGVQGLGQIGDATAVPLLIAALEDEDEDVRIDAADALGRIGSSEAVEPLLNSLRRDPCGDVKRAAAAALGAMRAVEAAPLLRALVAGRAEDEIAWVFRTE